jgi:cold shock CspA family protein
LTPTWALVFYQREKREEAKSKTKGRLHEADEVEFEIVQRKKNLQAVNVVKD